VTAWAPTWPYQGNMGHLRITASLLGKARPRACPEYLAAKTHPEVWPVQPWVDRRYSRYDTFPLGMVLEAVRLVESGDVSSAAEEPWSSIALRAVDASVVAGVANGDVHPAARVWAAHAVEMYLETAESLADTGAPLSPDGRRAVVYSNQTEIREMAIWGLGYMSPDGSLREFRLLRLKTATGGRPRSAQELATVAYVTANGQRVLDGGKWSEPFMVAGPDSAPGRVRIVDIGLLDGSTAVLWDGSPEQAHAKFTAVGRPLVPTITDGGSQVPQRSCADCRVRPVCDGLPARPGLLGLPDHGTHPKVLAPSNLWTYRVCPAKYLLTTDVRLPAQARVESPSMVRGTHVHRWLEHAHARQRRCTFDDLPTKTGELIDEAKRLSDDAGLTGDETNDIRPYLRQHLDTCPYATIPDIGLGIPERDVTVDDTDADVLIVTRPDLLLATDGGPIWRETKTASVMPTAEDLDLLHGYPQVAVAICILADRGLTDAAIMDLSGPGRGVVEMELLTSSASRLARFDADDEQTVLAARRELAAATYAWHRDEDYLATPGTACQFCEVARWCPDANADPLPAALRLDGLTIDTATGEVVGDDSASPGSLGLAASILGSAAPTDQDEDIPF
jgi:hypothetical protein